MLAHRTHPAPRAGADGTSRLLLPHPLPSLRHLPAVSPGTRELLQGVLACDLVGFHSRGLRAKNFLDCRQNERLGARVDHRESRVELEYGDLSCQVGRIPHRHRVRRPSPKTRRRRAPQERERHRTHRCSGWIASTTPRASPQRIRAFERLLELHPEHREKRGLPADCGAEPRSQVAEPTSDLKREIDELVGRLNGRFATSPSGRRSGTCIARCSRRAAERGCTAMPHVGP